MKKYTISLSNEVATFYSQIAQISRNDIEKVLADSLFRYAGELSIRELEKPTFELNKGGIKNDI